MCSFRFKSNTFQGKTGEDEVILDLSPLRTPQHFAEIARVCSAAHPGAKV